MKIQEYKAKEIFRNYAVAVQERKKASESKEARTHAEEIGKEVVVKAQIQSGGMGKS